MKRRVSSLVLPIVLLLAWGCDEPTRTQVVVRIDAEEGVRFLGRELHVEVYGGDGTDALPTGLRQSFDVKVDGSAASYPYAIALAPLDGHSSRVYRLVASAHSATGEVVATARLVSGYVPGRTVATTLLLEDACRGIACGDDQTCHAGACESAYVDPSTFGIVEPGTGSGGGPDGGDGGTGGDGGPTTPTGVCSYARGGSPPMCSVACSGDLLRTSIGFAPSTRKGTWLCADFTTSESLDTTGGAYRVTGFVPLGGTDGKRLVGSAQSGDSYSVEAR